MLTRFKYSNYAMVKHLISTLVLLASLPAQTPGDVDRRVAELEEKMRLIDPAFGRDSRALDLARRLQALEKKMDEVLTIRAAAEPPQPAATPQPARDASPAITQVSV